MIKFDDICLELEAKGFAIYQAAPFEVAYDISDTMLRAAYLIELCKNSLQNIRNNGTVQDLDGNRSFNKSAMLADEALVVIQEYSK
jgi:hypothetical protein